MSDTSDIRHHITNGLPDGALQQTLVNDEGVPVVISRLMGYVYDVPVVYKYAKLSLQGTTWTPELSCVRDGIDVLCGGGFNSVLINVYRDGRDEIRWHSDKEDQIGEKPVIPTLNLGASRTFHFLHKESGERVSVLLEDGDLLVMSEDCQPDCLHAVLKEKHVKDMRISLTFRKVKYV